MSSKFGLFRFLSIISLLVAGFFVLIMLLALLVTPALSAVLIFVLLTGSVVIHSVLSLSLQQSLKDPAKPLKSNTPGGIRIMGFMAIFYAVMLITNGIYGLIHLDEMLQEAMKQLPKNQPAPSLRAMRSLMTGLVIVLVLHAAGVLVNCALSFGYLRQWQEKNK
ncbi:hypothetical protein SAMN04488505_101370 [Chitinophaga rupis]|uniref:Uncharacterized protein n=1 Tax=Chitinophaga rupis TaxID=573321 RepID=A0A1H7HRM6_9BACT|nr:hypothetical protein [Chitinophaga rupis]SEK52828.1 hypothetical protein SAMN04488505_101370 [Chitinophaga rupis]